MKSKITEQLINWIFLFITILWIAYIIYIRFILQRTLKDIHLSILALALYVFLIIITGILIFMLARKIQYALAKDEPSPSWLIELAPIKWATERATAFSNRTRIAKETLYTAIVDRSGIIQEILYKTLYFLHKRLPTRIYFIEWFGVAILYIPRFLFCNALLWDMCVGIRLTYTYKIIWVLAVPIIFNFIIYVLNKHLEGVLQAITRIWHYEVITKFTTTSRGLRKDTVLTVQYRHRLELEQELGYSQEEISSMRETLPVLIDLQQSIFTIFADNGIVQQNIIGLLLRLVSAIFLVIGWSILLFKQII